MLNSFASDLDSILSDLSTSPPLDNPAVAAAAAAAASAASAAAPDDSMLPVSSGGEGDGRGGRGHASSCPDLSFHRGAVAEAPAPVPAPPPAPAPPAPPAPPAAPASAAPELSLLERLIRSHPIWYLPQLQRSAAVNLLQNQQQGVRRHNSIHHSFTNICSSSIDDISVYNINSQY